MTYNVFGGMLNLAQLCLLDNHIMFYQLSFNQLDYNTSALALLLLHYTQISLTIVLDTSHDICVCHT